MREKLKIKKEVKEKKMPWGLVSGEGENKKPEIREASNKEIVVAGDKLRINSENLILGVFYKFHYLGKDLYVRKSSDNKIRIFKAEE